METALIGLVGIILGIILNEILRKRNRIENYSARIFDKRIEIYEELFHRVNTCLEIANKVIDKESLTKEERLNMISFGVHNIAGFCDDNEFYINEELTVHCIAFLMGVEDIYYIKDAAEKKKEVERFNKNFIRAKKMIRKEAGLANLDRLFKSIIKPKHSSEIIDYYRELKKKERKKKLLS